MLIDCDTCEVRGRACRECVVTFLTIDVRPAQANDAPVVRLDRDQSAAVSALSSAGLVPPLRHSDHEHQAS